MKIRQKFVKKKKYLHMQIKSVTQLENFPLKIHVYKKLEQQEIEENALLLFRY